MKGSRLHIFNPEHDLALASNLANFTPPKAARELRRAWGALPVWWAREGDFVLVDDVAEARKMLATYVAQGLYVPDGVSFVEHRQLASLPIASVEPWGWDAALCAMLLRHGVKASLLPSAEALATIRRLSHRAEAASVLAELRHVEATVGEARQCSSAEEVEALVSEWGRAVVKSPWSCSGRGVRFVNDMEGASLKGWVARTLQQQGSVMVEPAYNRVADFAMEFESDGEGGISYLGLSLFATQGAAYTSNVIATEEEKYHTLEQYLPLTRLEEVREALCHLLSPRLRGNYRGPFGVDMMVVEGGLLHPCVEINLRRTMGHVAISRIEKR